jgi:Flp pilus assembly protein CpaB
MLRRIASTGLNLVVLGVSVAIFLVAFISLNALGAAQRPPTMAVLSAAHDLNIGDAITPDDIVVKNVFKDDNASLYIPGDEATRVVSGVVAQPIFSGQPILRSAILAQAAEGTRLSAALAKYPGYSLFPLPLDATNVIAPQVDAFLPGDLVGVTVVIGTRPQELTTPTAMPEVDLGSQYNLPATATPAPQEIAKSDALGRALPPLAKDIFPQGVRVISVQGQTPKSGATNSSDTSSSFSTETQAHMLMLLVPDASREVLSLALQQGDRLVVSLMARGDDSPTAGFTYWDFEDLFKADREHVLGGAK